jgi:nucleotide sugar dehydrogenase
MNPAAFFINLNDSIDNLLRVMGNVTPFGTTSGFAIVLNSLNELEGVVADSDLRRYILENSRLPIKIEELLNRKYVFINESDYEKNLSSSVYMALNKRGWKTKSPIRYLPVVNEKNEVVRVLNLDELNSLYDSKRDLVYVIGLGYVGLTLALFLSNKQANVIGIEISSKKVEKLLDKISYVNETGLQNLLELNINRYFKPSNTYGIIDDRAPGVNATFILCLPTPLDNLKNPDEKYLIDAIVEICNYVKPGDLIILRSTVAVGFSRKAAKIIEERTKLKIGSDFFMVFAPERTLEGNALIELENLPQIIGGITKECQKRGLVFFRQFVSSTIAVNTTEESELIKIASNSYRDYIFSFSNYLSIVAQNYSLDINTVIKNANSGYSRNNIPSPSPGVGGPCLSKDSYFMPIVAKNEESPILAARKFNESMPSKVVEFLKKQIGESLIKSEIAAIGLAFKGVPETNDLRNSVGIEIVNLLKKLNSNITYYEATVQKDFESDVFPAIVNPQVILVLNNHPKNIDIAVNILNKTSFSDIWLFDPWRLISSSFKSTTKTSINYLTLSNISSML